MNIHTLLILKRTELCCNATRLNRDQVTAAKIGAELSLSVGFRDFPEMGGYCAVNLCVCVPEKPSSATRTRLALFCHVHVLFQSLIHTVLITPD